ncbi:MAG: BREX system Lon protease-like protein BrxL [Promethearchaeota archaeon]
MKLPELDSLDKKAKDSFPNKVVRKVYAATIPDLRKLPTYVSEFLISDYADENGVLPKDAIERVTDLIKLKSHEKKDKEAIKSIAIELGSVEIIDHFEVFTDLRKGKYLTHISILDEIATVNRGLISPTRYQSLLKGGLYGKAKFQYVMRGDISSLNMSEFECYQTIDVILKKYIRNRKNFTTEEWIDFLVRSIGFNPSHFNRKQKLLYLARLIPMVETGTNLLELGPPSTGKSFLYENISEYCRILSGGEITPAKLIYDQNRRRIGIVFKKDVVCFDEINKETGRLNLLLPKLQQMMASNRIERGDLEAITGASLVFQGNIDFKFRDNKRVPKEENYLKTLPKGMYDSAFLDRIHIFLQGWEFERISSDALNRNLGLISNYFGQVLHKLRRESVSYLIDEKLEFYKLDLEDEKKGISIRDKNALNVILSGLIKLIFPDKQIKDEEWKEIADFAIDLRQNVINEIQKIDVTLKRTIGYEFMDKSRTQIDDQSEIITPGVIESLEEEIRDQRPLNYEHYKLDFLQICVDANNYISKQTPYWILKVLVEDEKLLAENRNYRLKSLENMGLMVKVIEKTPIETSSTSVNKEYANYEENLDNVERLLDKYLKVVDNYQNHLKKLARYKIYSSDLDKSPEIDELIKKMEEKENQIISIPISFIREIDREINQLKTFIQKSRGIDTDLLSYNYLPLILNLEIVNKTISDKIVIWMKETDKFKVFLEIYSKLKPFIDKMIKKRSKARSRAKSKFEGKKFPLFAFDVNNLLISFKKKYPNYYRSKEPPIVKIKKQYLRNTPYLAYFFATHQLSRHLAPIQRNEFNHLYFETMVKDRSSGKFVDIDTYLATVISPIIEIYKDQISHFYLGSGDKDFHALIEKAKGYNIPTSLIVIEDSNLSNDFANLVSNVIYLY